MGLPGRHKETAGRFLHSPVPLREFQGTPKLSTLSPQETSAARHSSADRPKSPVEQCFNIFQISEIINFIKIYALQHIKISFHFNFELFI